MTARRLAARIGCIRPDCVLAEAARILIRDTLRSLLVLDEESDALVGILTERDIVRQLAEGADPDTIRVDAFMSRPVTTLPEDASRGEIMQRMRVHGIRHVPLVDAEGNTTRVVALDDLLGEIGEELSDAAAALRAEFQREIEKTRVAR